MFLFSCLGLYSFISLTTQYIYCIISITVLLNWGIQVLQIGLLQIWCAFLKYFHVSQNVFRSLVFKKKFFFNFCVWASLTNWTQTFIWSLPVFPGIGVGDLTLLFYHAVYYRLLCGLWQIMLSRVNSPHIHRQIITDKLSADWAVLKEYLEIWWTQLCCQSFGS